MQVTDTKTGCCHGAAPVSEDAQVCLDVHTCSGIPPAIDLGDRLEAFHLFFVEDPPRSENSWPRQRRTDGAFADG